VIRLGVIGLGKWGWVLSNAAKASPNLRICKGFSRSVETRQAFAKSFDVQCPADVNDILDDPRIDGVILALPNELHLEFAVRCIRAGKPVFIEKPVTHTLAEAIELKKIADQYQARIFVGHCAKLLNGVQQMKKVLESGSLGELCLLEGRFCNERGLQLTPKDWRFYQEKAPGGPLSQIAIHQFDVLRYLGGPVAEVSAMSAKRSPVGAEVEDQWNIQLKFMNGALGVVTTSWTSPGLFEVRFIGTKGLIHYQIDQTKWGQAALLHEGASLRMQFSGGLSNSIESLPVEASDMFLDELEQFVLLIKGQPQPHFDLNYATDILSIVESAKLSDQKLGLRVDPRGIVASY
jgi:predicted dehydrogenase